MTNEEILQQIREMRDPSLKEKRVISERLTSIEKTVDAIVLKEGPEGIQGMPGVDGKDGPEGIVGPMGPQGLQGEQGLKGDRGLRGEKGDTGEQGIPGKDGRDGSSPAVEDLINMTVFEMKKTPIEMKDINGLDKLIQHLKMGGFRGGGGSGGSSIVPSLQQVTDIGNTTTNRVRIGSSILPAFELDVSGKAPTLIGPTFSGSGLNDMTLSGTFTSQYDVTFVVTIQSLTNLNNLLSYHNPGAINFAVGETIEDEVGNTGVVTSVFTTGSGISKKWFLTFTTSDDWSGSTNVDNAPSGGSVSTPIITYTPYQLYDKFSVTRNGVGIQNGVDITTLPQVLGNGLSITFGATSGHTIGDKWTIKGTNENIVNTSGSYRMENLDGTFSGLFAGAGSDSTFYQWPTTSSTGVLKNASGILSWGAADISIGEPILGSNPKYMLGVDNSGNLAQFINNNSIEMDFGLGMNVHAPQGFNIATGAYTVTDNFNNVFYQFDLGGSGLLTQGDIFNHFGAGNVNRFNLSTGEVYFQTTGQWHVIDPFSNNFLSIDIGSKIYAIGDYNTSFNGTYISIEDAASVINLFATNGLTINGNAGYTGTITTAALTTLGSTGSMTFEGGIITAQTPAT
jgi:hypothetical protein